MFDDDGDDSVLFYGQVVDGGGLRMVMGGRGGMRRVGGRGGAT